MKLKTKQPIGVCECCHGIIYNKRGNYDKRLPKYKIKRTLYCKNCADYITKIRKHLMMYYKNKYKGE